MQETTKKLLPIVSFLIVIIGVGIFIFLMSDSKASGTASQEKNEPQTSTSTQNSDPIENIDQKWVKGNPDAKVKIIEYSDFQCPYCKKGADSVGAIYEKYKDQVSVTFVHFPLNSIHPAATPAAQAAEAAGLQGKFWEMHDLLFNNQGNLTKSDFISYAKKLELDIQLFEKHLNNTNVLDKVNKQLKEAESQEFEEIALDENDKIISKGKTKIEGTPAFLINGKLVFGAYPLEKFEKFILAELNKK